MESPTVMTGLGPFTGCVDVRVDPSITPATCGRPDLASNVPAGALRCRNAGPALAQRRRRWASAGPACSSQAISGDEDCKWKTSTQQRHVFKYPNTAAQRQTVTATLTSKQIQLFVFVLVSLSRTVK